ncbi:MAG: hypothetical protein EOM37_06035 [Proteobacteria bacterium]|jgi:hypothetical protein|nr:hypothetical protein [Alphaproteobacteria bacterium]NCC03589.1 hypothetical protein [Pseudomonadota bacterium]
MTSTEKDATSLITALFQGLQPFFERVTQGFYSHESPRQTPQEVAQHLFGAQTLGFKPDAFVQTGQLNGRPLHAALYWVLGDPLAKPIDAPTALLIQFACCHVLKRAPRPKDPPLLRPEANKIALFCDEALHHIAKDYPEEISTTLDYFLQIYASTKPHPPLRPQKTIRFVKPTGFDYDRFN